MPTAEPCWRPDLDDLPPELTDHPGPLYYAVHDPGTGQTYPLRQMTTDEIATLLADERRRREDEVG